MTKRDQHSNSENWVLAALGHHERQRLLQHADAVSLTRDQPVGQAGQPLSQVYFPVGAIVSAVQKTTGGGMHEVATIGRDGMVGLSSFLAQEVLAWDLHCQIPGHALRLPAETLGTLDTATPVTRQVLGRYAYALLLQIARNAACNQLHSMIERCSRWILLVHRQCGRDEFPLTQQSLAAMLAVRRATVTVTARALKEAGAIGYHHGSLRVANAAVLNELACDCYDAIVESYDVLLRP
jgi:CRP-like cAMP-binding protein